MAQEDFDREPLVLMVAVSKDSSDYET